jgi:hypothetical protein
MQRNVKKWVDLRTCEDVSGSQDGGIRSSRNAAIILLRWESTVFTVKITRQKMDQASKQKHNLPGKSALRWRRIHTTRCCLHDMSAHTLSHRKLGLTTAGVCSIPYTNIIGMSYTKCPGKSGMKTKLKISDCCELRAKKQQRPSSKMFQKLLQSTTRLSSAHHWHRRTTRVTRTKKVRNRKASTKISKIILKSQFENTKYVKIILPV